MERKSKQDDLERKGKTKWKLLLIREKQNAKSFKTPARYGRERKKERSNYITLVSTDSFLKVEGKKMNILQWERVERFQCIHKDLLRSLWETERAREEDFKREIIMLTSFVTRRFSPFYSRWTCQSIIQVWMMKLRDGNMTTYTHPPPILLTQ